MGKGSNTTQTSSTSSADPQAAATYRMLLDRASGVASTPYQAYSGDLTAPVNSQQQAGISGINANANYASPFINQAAGLAGASSAPITGADIQGYQNPYTQQVVDATTGQLQHDNATQMASLQGNQISQGALGGNATGVAKGILAGQQGRTMASTTAGLYDQSYQQALRAAQQQQQTGLAGANAFANYGLSGQNAALTGATAQIGAGSLQQATEQARLNALYGQYAQAQAYPYQQTQWLAGLGTGVGSNLGTSSSGQTTGPAPNQTAQYLGAGLSAAALLSDERAKEDIHEVGKTHDGQKIYRYRYKGQPQWHMGLIAQEVEEDHPEAVERGLGGMRYVDMKEATDDAVRRAMGGGVAGPTFNERWDGEPRSTAWDHFKAGARDFVGGAHDIVTGVSPPRSPIGSSRDLWDRDRRNGYAAGGVPTSPWGDAGGWIPKIDIHGGSAPHAGSAPGVAATPAFDMSKYTAGLTGLKNANLSQYNPSNPFLTSGDANPFAYSGVADQGAIDQSMSTLGGNSGGDFYGPGFATGGGVAGYAVGGVPMMEVSDGGLNPLDEEELRRRIPDTQLPPGGRFEDRATPARQAIAAGDFDPAGANSTTFEGSPGMVASNTGVVPMPAVRPTEAPVVAEGDDDEEVPTGVSGRTRGVAGPSVAAFAPEGAPGSYGSMPDAIRRPAEEERSGLGFLPLSKNAGAGLLTAGLGMLASRSPFLGNAIGEGGLAGVNAYGKAEEHDRQVAAEADKLAREAREKQAKFGLDVRKQGETERHNKATENKDFKPTWGQVDEDPITGRKIMGWIDPNKKTTTIPGKAGADTAAPAPGTIPPDLRGADYMAELEKRNPEFARTAKAVGDYRTSIASLSQRGGLREKILEAALRYNPEYDQAHYGEKTRAVGAFAAGPEGRAVRSLNVSIDHLDTLREAGDALKNGDLPLLNKIVNYAREKTGSLLTTNFDSIKQVVSAEIAKAVVGGQTALHDRDDMAKRAANSQSPDQLNGIITQFQKLMAGQMKGLRRQYEATTRLKNFDDYLEPGTKRVLGGLGHVKDNWNDAGGGGASPAGGLPPQAERVVNKNYTVNGITKKWTGEGWVNP